MGIPNFAPAFDTDHIKPFYEGLEKKELRLTACSVCGTWHWYPPDILPCHPEGHIVWKSVKAEGTIYMFTEVQRSLLPGDHKSETPFTVIFVESDDVPGARVPSTRSRRSSQSSAPNI